MREIASFELSRLQLASGRGWQGEGIGSDEGSGKGAREEMTREEMTREGMMREGMTSKGMAREEMTREEMTREGMTRGDASNGRVSGLFYGLFF